jgi:hypothetical protein
MFGVEWLRGGSVVERETIGAASQIEAIEKCRRNAPAVAGRIPGREPDSFRLLDAGGREIGIYPIRT